MNENTIIMKNQNIFGYRKGYKILAFLLGFLVTNNIVYIIRFGEVVPNISILYSILILCYYIIFRLNDFQKALRMFNITLFLYVLIILFSVINVVIVFYGNIYMLIRYFKGVIYLFMHLAPYVLTLILYKEKRYIIKGLGVGFSVNLLISIISYFYFSIGKVFTLYNLFPQNAFYIPRYTFRTQGLFLEPSYYMAFIISTFLILLVSTKSGMYKILGIIFTVFVVSISLSKNTPILIFLLLLFILLEVRGNRNKRIIIKYPVLITTVFFCLIGSIVVVLNWEKIIAMNLLKNLMVGWNKLLDLDSSRSIRIFNMKQALYLIPKYPFGVGYNMSHSIMEDVYSNNISVNATFNFLITNQLELGLLGTGVYLIMIKQLSWDLIIKHKDKYSLALGMSVFGAFLTQIGNGIRLYPFILVVFGLATIESFSLKNGSYKTKAFLEKM